MRAAGVGQQELWVMGHRARVCVKPHIIIISSKTTVRLQRLSF
jgi:hypothetical protein